MPGDDLLSDWLHQAGEIARKGLEEAQRAAEELAASPEGRQILGVAEEGLTELGKAAERLAATPEGQQVLEVAGEVVAKVGEGAQVIARDLQGTAAGAHPEAGDDDRDAEDGMGAGADEQP